MSRVLVILFFDGPGPIGKTDAESAEWYRGRGGVELFGGGLEATIVAMNVNFAERAHNHNWKLDPIVRSLLDTDFYKLLMLQFIWKNFPAVHVTSEVVNRTVEVRLAERVSAAALIDQMEHVRGLSFGGRSWFGWRVIRSMECGVSLSRRFWIGWRRISG